jgi:chromosome segregation ATPase
VQSREAKEQHVLDGFVATWRKAFGEDPLPLAIQKQMDKVFKTGEQVSLTVPGGNHLRGQPVLGMTFCINRRKEIARLAGNAVLRDNYTDLRTERIFEKFRLVNSSGDRPYYCVSEDILGRAIHTFQEEYVSKSKAQAVSEEFTIHLGEIVAEAKDSMSKEAVAIRMRNKNLVDQQHRLREEARIQCERAFADVNQRMKDTSDAYAAALEQQTKLLEQSAITEDTLLDEMLQAAQAHRSRIHAVTAIPPLVMDADRLQLQVRCAAAEEKVEDLQKQLHDVLSSDKVVSSDKVKLDEKVRELQNELEGLQQRESQAQRALDSREADLYKVRREKTKMQLELVRVNKDLNEANQRNLALTQHTQRGDLLMQGLKTRVETAEGELERLKRKRADSNSPVRTVTSILKRPVSPRS